MNKKIYRLKIVIDADGDIEYIQETLDADKTVLVVKGVDVSEYLDDESNEAIQGCTEVGLT